MLEYYLNDNNVNVELVITSGGLRVTGQTPTVAIRNKDTGYYFDFASNTFTATTTSATAVLSSAIDGLYTYAWDTSGVFTTNTHLTFEYHNGTGFDSDDVLFTRQPIGTADAGGGSQMDVLVKGLWSPDDKQTLFNKLNDMSNNLANFRRNVSIKINKILGDD